MKPRIANQNIFISAGITVAFCLLAAMSFAQPVTIVSPVTNQTYKLADPAAMQNAAELQSAIANAESAAKALITDAANEKAAAVTDENGLDKTTSLKNDYITAVNAFNKNDVTPYKADLDNYTATGTKFNDLLAKHNKAVLANNALAAKDRKMATVTALNKEKAQIDAQAALLGKWKDKLDAAKAKLDVKNAALQKQQQKYEALDQASSAKLKASKIKLKSLSDQLAVCANYADKCQALLVSKFKAESASNAGYFTSPAYKSAVADLNAYLDKIKNR
jgi:hypothetical protein